MPAAPSCRRPYAAARAAGGPAEETFAALVGLELRPRRLRDASALWGSLRTRQGTEGRDGVWMHPDLLPTAADLDDPLGLPRGRRHPCRSRTRTSTPGCASCSTDRDPGRRDPPREGPRRRRSPCWRAGRPPSPHDATLRDRYVAHLRSHPDGLLKALLPRPPDGRRDRRVATTATPCSSTTTARRTPGSPSAATSRPSDRSLADAARRELVEESGLTVVRLRPHAAVPRRARGRLLLPARHCAPPRRPVPRHGRPRAGSTRSATSRSTCAGGRSTRCQRPSTTCIS